MKNIEEFVDKVDALCREYNCEIWATEKINYRNEDGNYPTFTIHSEGKKLNLIYIDGDGNGK